MTYTCNRGSVPSALKEILKCERTHVVEVKHAHPDTFNGNKRLWTDVKDLPKVPFGVGVWYKKKHRLIPLGIVRNVRPNMTVGEFKNNAKKPPISMAVLMQHVLDRMTYMHMGSPPFNGEHDEIARCAMWLACAPEERIYLKNIDDKYNNLCHLNYCALDVDAKTDEPLGELRMWVLGWAKAQARL